mmetsp:Transcript_13200/g.17413  ORF Transcript_13200/g.17413 Transcript_13200/m.17413 type:complete len:185 (-) Transcript_13200:343-897(-)
MIVMAVVGGGVDLPMMVLEEVAAVSVVAAEMTTHATVEECGKRTIAKMVAVVVAGVVEEPDSAKIRDVEADSVMTDLVKNPDAASVVAVDTTEEEAMTEGEEEEVTTEEEVGTTVEMMVRDGKTEGEVAEGVVKKALGGVGGTSLKTLPVATNAPMTGHPHHEVRMTVVVVAGVAAKRGHKGGG